MPTFRAGTEPGTADMFFIYLCPVELIKKLFGQQWTSCCEGPEFKSFPQVHFFFIVKNLTIGFPSSVGGSNGPR